MPDPSLLGCPHCGKAIAFAAELAGKLASCPHCRGPFQMPATPPAPAPQKAAAPSQPASSKRAAPDLAFDPDLPLTHTTGQRRDRYEPTFFSSAEQGSLVVAVCGTILAVAIGVTVLILALEIFQLPGVKSFILAILASLGAIAILVGGIAGSWLLRHVVLATMDYLRNRWRQDANPPTGK